MARNGGDAVVGGERHAPQTAKGSAERRPRRPRSLSTSSSSWSVNIGSVVMIVGSLLVMIAAIMAKRGFRGRDHTVGIDLGTTYSVVAISQNNSVTVIPDDSGFLITPSIVAFLPNGQRLVGRDARAYRTVDPKHTIFNAKRFIGQSFHDITTSRGDAPSPYEFQVTTQSTGGENASVCFAIDVPGHPRCVTPVDVGSWIVGHLRTLATRFVGHNQINKAVIAVPVDFNAKQRAATVAAFKAAGLQVTRVLEEPTAAAIAYGLHQKSSVNFILVFDFGGGTLDVSLLFSRSGSISVVDTMGDNNLGGEDIDAIVAEYITHDIEAQLRQELSATGEATGESERVAAEPTDILPCTRAGIRRAAEMLKRKLSSTPVATASCIVPGPEKLRLEVTMSRDKLEEMCLPLLERTLVPVREILEANSMVSSDVDAVVLVGGSTRLPWVRRRLAETFGGREPLTDIDPDIAVAVGAARTVD